MNKNHLEITQVDHSPVFQKPEIVGFFNLDAERTFHSTAANLKYLYKVQPDAKLNLNLGFNHYQQKKETMENEEKIDALLSWLITNQYLRNILDPEVAKTTFICYRGLLTTVMRTPYEQGEDWIICATKVKNLIFLCVFYTNRKKEQIQKGQTSQEKRFEFWGRKFEQYMLSDNPRQKPNLNQRVNANEEFSLLFSSKLNTHSILYGAETDGVDSSDPVQTDVNQLNSVEFVELKTSRRIESHRQDRNFKKYKLLKWWSQCFMAGIERVICGFRDDNGIVGINDVKEYWTKDMPNIAKTWWNPGVCLSFLEDFFAFVEDSLSEENDFSTWKFYWKPRDIHVVGEKVLDSSVYKVLPNWFVSQCNNYLRETF